jgi:hypothetical protein
MVAKDQQLLLLRPLPSLHAALTWLVIVSIFPLSCCRSRSLVGHVYFLEPGVERTEARQPQNKVAQSRLAMSVFSPFYFNPFAPSWSRLQILTRFLFCLSHPASRAPPAAWPLCLCYDCLEPRLARAMGSRHADCAPACTRRIVGPAATVMFPLVRAAKSCGCRVEVNVAPWRRRLPLPSQSAPHPVSGRP